MPAPRHQQLLDLIEEGPPSPERPDPLSIAQLYNEVERVLARSFPRSRLLWVRGEVQHISDRRGHCFIDLVDPDERRDRQAPVLKVRCWRTGWTRLRGVLEREGVTLQPGMVVNLRGSLDFYRAKAEIDFLMAELDVTSLIGELAARRAALLRTLAGEGLIERNKALPLPPVPLKVGLVASPGTEGHRDFMGQLEASGWGFEVHFAPAVVQGPEASRSVVRALRTVAAQQPDLVVVVRGGGSKGDLAAFDSEPVARTIATLGVPVWTGIGHSGDESVADVVAHRSHITPTHCGRELAALVASWWEADVRRRATAIERAAAAVVAEAGRRATTTRAHLAGSARHQLRWHAEHLAARRGSVATGTSAALERASSELRQVTARLPGLAAAHLARGDERLQQWRRLVSAYDIERQLERGYTLTTDGDGKVLRRAGALGPGQLLITRFADGTARSRVEGEAASTGAVQRDG